MSLLSAWLFFSTLRFVHFTTKGHEMLVYPGQQWAPHNHFYLPLGSLCFLPGGDTGVCERVDICPAAREMLYRRERPPICSFDKYFPLLPIVCCKREEASEYPDCSVPEPDDPEVGTDRSEVTRNPLEETNDGSEMAADRSRVTTDRSQVTTDRQRTGTDPVRPNLDLQAGTSTNRSIEQCDAYSGRSYSRPLKPGESGIFVVGGTDSDPKEFPHVALLGYGDSNDLQWLCGGTIVSENFILTAAHCLEANDIGPVRVVRVGDLDIKSDKDDADPQQFEVAETFQHPEYNPENRYHDLALLRLNDSISFNIYVKPACLHMERALPDAQLVATGWGQTFFGGDTASILQKVNLTATEHSRCARVYNRRIIGLPDGLIADWQLCAHGTVEGGDTCQGDSGAPLQYRRGGDTLHRIVGVTSFGINCGLVPGVYGRVSFYVPWIESVVWPS